MTVVKFLRSCSCDVINVLKSTALIFMLFLPCIFLHSMCLTSKMYQVNHNTPVHKTHFVLGATSYMFRHQGVMFRGVLDLRSFVVNKLHEDDTLVPKQVGVGT